MIIKEYNFPNFEEILKLEKIANKEGSGIVADDLVGYWKFQYVYKKGSVIIDNISSSLLQILYASLELKDFCIKDNIPTFEIRNSIRFGIFSIIFSGRANLKGTRPILPFYFDQLLLKIFNITFINQSLKKADPLKMPFFSLIALAENKKWMCARGKGGGIAIWIKS